VSPVDQRFLIHDQVVCSHTITAHRCSIATVQQALLVCRTSRAVCKVSHTIVHVASGARLHVGWQVVLDRAFFACLTRAFPIFSIITVFAERPPSFKRLDAGHATGHTRFQRRVFETAITDCLPFLVVDHYPGTFAY
jgi:hypothetical protein